MRELYLFAMANLVMCAAIGFIALCRLNAMREGVLWRVRIEYAAYIGAVVAYGLMPMFGHWPSWVHLSMPAAVLCGLLASNNAWRNDTPPASASEVGSLRRMDGSPL